MGDFIIIQKDIEHIKNNQKIYGDKIRVLELKVDEMDHKFDKRLSEHETGRSYDREKLNDIDRKLKDLNDKLTQINNSIIRNEGAKNEKTKTFENLKWFLSIFLASGFFELSFRYFGLK